MTLRIARHTNNIQPLIEFYTKVLNLHVLGEFKKHNDYDGVFIGGNNLPWELEFTQSKEFVKYNYNEDDLYVFYPETKENYDSLLMNIEANHIKKRSAKNPYWNSNGVLIQDPDGYNIVISPNRITPQ